MLDAERAEAMLRSLFADSQLDETDREHIIQNVLDRTDELLVGWDDFLKLAAVQRILAEIAPGGDSLTFAHEVDGPWRLELNGVTIARHGKREELKQAIKDLRAALARRATAGPRGDICPATAAEAAIDPVRQALDVLTAPAESDGVRE